MWEGTIGNGRVGPSRGSGSEGWDREFHHAKSETQGVAGRDSVCPTHLGYSPRGHKGRGHQHGLLEYGRVERFVHIARTGPSALYQAH